MGLLPTTAFAQLDVPASCIPGDNLASYNSAVFQSYDANEELTQANAQLQAAQEAYDACDVDALKAAYDQASKEYDDAVAAQSSAKSAKYNAQERLNAANNRSVFNIERGSAGFFDYLCGVGSSANAVKTYANDEYHTTLGAAGDATSLDNMKIVAEMVNEINRLRATEGVAPLSINIDILFQAECRTNYGAVEGNHHALGTGSVRSENLAWGYTSATKAADAWWSEKTIWEAWCAENPEYANLTTTQVYQKNATLYMKVGHYLNMRDASFTSVGVGYNNASGRTWGACFGKNAAGLMTVDEFTKKFDEYMALVSSSPEDAVAAAQQAYDEAVAAYAAATTTVENAGYTRRNAMDAYNRAQDIRENHPEEYEAAQQELSAAQAAQAQAQQNAADAQAALEAARIAAAPVHSYRNGVCTTCGHVFGDVNQNGSVNIVDAQLAYDFAINTYDGHEDEFMLWANSNVNGDNVVDASDALAIQSLALNPGK